MISGLPLPPSRPDGPPVDIATAVQSAIDASAAARAKLSGAGANEWMDEEDEKERGRAREEALKRVRGRSTGELFILVSFLFGRVA